MLSTPAPRRYVNGRRGPRLAATGPARARGPGTRVALAAALLMALGASVATGVEARSKTPPPAVPAATPPTPVEPAALPQAPAPVPTPRVVVAARSLAPASPVVTPVEAPVQLPLAREPASPWAPAAREPASPWVQLARAPAPAVVRTRGSLPMLLLTVFFALIFVGCVTAFAYLLLA